MGMGVISVEGDSGRKRGRKRWGGEDVGRENEVVRECVFVCGDGNYGENV